MVTINKKTPKQTQVKDSHKKRIDREREMKLRQLPNVDPSKKLRFNDIHRIAQHTNTSIFDEDECCLWTGYITNRAHKNKGTYINFYFRSRKKVALHRLLYANFKGDISNNEYIKFSCPHKGECCNVNHMVKFEYTLNDQPTIPNENIKKEPKKTEISTRKFLEADNFKISLVI